VRRNDITYGGAQRPLANDSNHLGHLGASIVGHIEPGPDLQHKISSV
jgi:hypothetical protein